jgi:hypothetical protein
MEVLAASRLLRRVKVRDYITGLSQEAMARAQAEREGAVASIEESLRFLTIVMRARLVDYLDPEGAVDVERLKAAPPGLVRRCRAGSP